LVCPAYILEVLRKPLWNKETRRAAPTKENGAQMNKADSFTEIYLWNLSVDRLIRVLERLELHSIRSPRDLRAYAIRLEEVRAGLNADFAEVIAARERADEFRFWSWRTALEKQKQRAN
jgi:hypothetical protein